MIDPTESVIPPGTRPGYVQLSPSRVVFWTGRVACGLRYQRPCPPYRERASERDAELLQDLLRSS